MVSQRGADVTPFIAMDVLERANELDDVIHLEVGEPDFAPPDRVIETAVDSLRSGNTNYTAARGKPELRRAIAAHYDREYGVDVDPNRVVITPGTSPGLLLTMAALVDPGEEVVLTDPHYACYPNFVRMVEGRVRTVPLRASEGFQPRIADFEAAVSDDTRALLLNSPANPTGAVMDGETLAGLADVAAAHDATPVVDEVYHGLSYDVAEHTMLEYTDDAFVLNGFSKRFAMTGWRLGWVIVPPDYVDVVNRLAQNLLICAPNFVQDAGVAALETPPERLAEIRTTYRERRDLLVDAVEAWGLDLGYTPQGAYYLLADVSDLPGDALDVADLFLDAGVAVTPGVDFGDEAADYLRFSYATDADAIETAIERIDRVLATVERR
ncbi:pyridoxal phosphate-dependent aminotransferase [Haloplanus aerogenes]|uniref:Aminotransferase n=1 Tax=Haloplanus aerogenes TaxID=660522 RepID=A0A3M0CW56_9EURY|nr:pyridoxal phosphate-dependent aminotransferase [Haloplanus aerogenes]AZH24039.1 pyridoxal phosphate-dependent aminotransferase [Haloplanus aerogenes]RMB13187.1 aspartate/methionine/tyrosine aminotransferase [Haloplanus aerogenes]